MNLQGASKEPQMMRHYKYFLILTQRYIYRFERDGDRERNIDVMISCLLNALDQGLNTQCCGVRMTLQITAICPGLLFPLFMILWQIS